MKRNNVDAALIIEVSKPIAYGQYQFEKGDKLTYDVNSNLFIYRSESYSEDEDGAETTSIIAFGVDPDFVLDNADHFTCLIKKGILDKVKDDDKVEDNTDNSHDYTDKQEDKPFVDTDEQGDADTPDEVPEKVADYDAMIKHIDGLSKEELEKDLIKLVEYFSDLLSCYELSFKKRMLGRRDYLLINPAIDLMLDLKDIIGRKLKRFNEQKKSIDDCVGEACDSAR